MIRVMLVDDQSLVRSGFRLILDVEDDMTIVGEAADGEEAVESVQRCRPDIVLMDVQMPRMDGLEATRRIVAQPDPPKVVILSTFGQDDYLFEALRIGASGFLLKNAQAEELVAAIRVVAQGEALLDPAVTSRVIEEFARSGAVAAQEPPAVLGTLTEREHEVLLLMGAGMTNAEIAAALILGEATIKTYVSNVLAKLALRDRVQAVVYVYEHGLVRPGNQ